MIPINLLPHRAQRRSAQRRQFFVLAGMVFGLGVAIVALVHTYFAGQIEYQSGRNQYLEGEIAVLDRQIDEIKKLKEQMPWVPRPWSRFRTAFGSACLRRATTSWAATS